MSADRRLQFAPRLATGFSLVELLVSVAIIGVIASLSLAAVVQARAMARTTHCRSNLHQIGVALHVYLDVHRERFPEAAQLPSLTPDKPSLAKVLSDYVEGNQAVFACPADAQRFDTEGISYEYPARRVAGKTMADLVRRRDEVVREPRHVWVLYDFDDVHPGGTRNTLYADGHVETH